ncbi:hypothetical protein [Flavobacterium hercynium]|uniref:Uncharacterized protein n=1 Tax=Flavobacterium hercynium TaxID=387094 RepID=A0A226H9U9_9FLAO|nr:hypothetical protein [Flavobacterium hercynium]OXA90421.1 hypothetical protein B0A66_12695 [Flavobacterium hercynium]SMP26162.1 hypothetical protein SAMN06265346_10968 [Flavobacterium hercynium]
MKKLGLAVMLLMSVLSHAQVSINVNIGTPPSWGPEGHDDSRYYYLPDIDVYYDVNQSQFIYDNGGKWTRAKNLPAQHKKYDLYDGYKVVVNDYKGDDPYNYHTKHRASYPKGYKGEPQKNRGSKPVKNGKSGNKQQPNKDNSKKGDNPKRSDNDKKGDKRKKTEGHSKKEQQHSNDDRRQ